MGSPQYGQLILDRKPTPWRDIESESLTWSSDRRLLAAQELVSWGAENPRGRDRCGITEPTRRLTSAQRAMRPA